MTRALLSLGSNLGDRLGHLRTALATFGESVLMVSGVYETPPWGDVEQPAYLNAVLLAVDPAAGPYDWLARARAAEHTAGRVRDPQRRFGPRTLDVDVIAVWADDDRQVLSDDPELTLPHPRAHLRAFVLRPWIDIQPYGQLPGHGRLTDLLTCGPAAAEVAELRPRPDLRLESGA
ncbi:2-amino-4-hydroxy-6-hydroxymethyldihydropteridine diphosphokinase [Micromonospora endophytica]|uniref:2-amino-4-hydroxy-6-hydroxymethyldihydropteridine diphosphokinase n=1 Tax=Micromonospora endophytica TaxID=515350 RepID=A0A2W2CN51_9ACTN|nr:2-amino-4-hydroxy-6-hydroxymethyldihydropteridine diphosphokinase [Micromonospora endophytica]PZF99992.1 2-amino-4-hydroxy-6-hydroxymethyldihydropteridine diphosphokinase [Micromonospora endophytica]RIW46623.1 2-amino-4-hydroxy-6-hydroxymethyldihydropteridine diphosphokinase [Micromonospora endophytica]BCJ59840.1 2-amino-4-hydroxy-6-hydroxymethyldihydropteridine diphosphokinase [Micromonospora endophytica]